MSKYETSLKNGHSSLFYQVVSDKEKSFITNAHGAKFVKQFTVVIYKCQ